MPGCHVTDQQMRRYMTLKLTNSIPVAATKAGFSQATGYRLQADPTLGSSWQPQVDPDGGFQLASGVQQVSTCGIHLGH